MEKEKLKSYGIDYENAVKRFAGKEALYEKFLNKFTEDNHLEIGEKALLDGNYPDVLEAVHALKGVAGTLGMMDLFYASSAVVSAIRNDDTGNLEDLMKKVREEYDKACEAVNECAF